MKTGQYCSTQQPLATFLLFCKNPVWAHFLGACKNYVIFCTFQVVTLMCKSLGNALKVERKIYWH